MLEKLAAHDLALKSANAALLKAQMDGFYFPGDIVEYFKPRPKMPRTCEEIRRISPLAGDGAYSIDPLGNGRGFLVDCFMNHGEIHSFCVYIWMHLNRTVPNKISS